MQNSTICFFEVKSFQFVNDQLRWEQRSIHCDDCHSPPQALRIGLDDDRSPPGRLAAVARSDLWTTPPAQVGFSGDVVRRRRFPTVVGSDLWNNSRGRDYLQWDRRGEDCNPEDNFFAPFRLSTAKMVLENRAGGYLPHSGSPYMLWSGDAGIAEPLTMDLYGTGSMATACWRRRKKSLPRLRDFRRLKRNVNSSR